MRIAKYISIATFLLVFANSCDRQETQQTDYWGVPIVKTERLYYSNGKICRELHFINSEGLDGFWDSYSIHGDMGRTQLYLNSKVDTSWRWTDNQPAYEKYSDDYTSMNLYLHDTTELRNYVRGRIDKYFQKN